MTKSIFITGAASGIGKATAISFAKNGWNVGLFDINQEGLKEVAEIIGHNKCCLLYTSPSPRDRVLSRMPSSA